MAAKQKQFFRLITCHEKNKVKLCSLLSQMESYKYSSSQNSKSKFYLVRNHFPYLKPEVFLLNFPHSK